MKRTSLARPAGRTVLYALAGAWALLSLYPVLYMFINGIRTEEAFLAAPFGLPVPPSFSRLRDVWRGGGIGLPIGRFFLNSVVVTAAASVSILIASLYCAFALAKYRMASSRLVHAVMLAALAIPVHATLVPVFVMLGEVGLRNSYLGLTAVYTAFWIPFTVIVLTANLKEFPNELIESARIDGASEDRIFWQIVTPMSTGTISSLAIVNAVGLWSELLFAFLLMNRAEMRTLTAGLRAFQGQYVVEWTQIFAALTIASLPVVLAFLLFERQITKGMTLGALK